jgi:hypothetical protein
VQRYLRQSSVLLKNGELLLVGRSKDTAIAAAAHLMFMPISSGTETFIAAVAVTRKLRGKGEAIADEALQARSTTRTSPARHLSFGQDSSRIQCLKGIINYGRGV